MQKCPRGIFKSCEGTFVRLKYLACLYFTIKNIVCQYKMKNIFVKISKTFIEKVVLWRFYNVCEFEMIINFKNVKNKRLLLIVMIFVIKSAF